MEAYNKPTITGNKTSGLFPVMGAPVFISPIAPVAAVAAAILTSRKGDNIIDSTHTSALTARKDFGFA